MATPVSPPKRMSALKENYLISYNAINTALWFLVFSRTLATLLKFGPEAIYSDVGQFTKWTQTLAGLEILHSVLGVVRAPLLTTLMQVGSRFALVWGAVHFYPSIATSPAYSSMLLAWSTTEVVRYGFFTLTLSGWEPGPLLWLRYSSFFVLYPVGISSELWELGRAFLAARNAHEPWAMLVILLVMATYGPGAPKLYRHMMRQRRRVLGSGAHRTQ